MRMETRRIVSKSRRVEEISKTTSLFIKTSTLLCAKNVIILGDAHTSNGSHLVGRTTSESGWKSDKVLMRFLLNLTGFYVCQTGGTHDHFPLKAQREKRDQLPGSSGPPQRSASGFLAARFRKCGKANRHCAQKDSREPARRFCQARTVVLEAGKTLYGLTYPHATEWTERRQKNSTPENSKRCSMPSAARSLAPRGRAAAFTISRPIEACYPEFQAQGLSRPTP
jgi:hypothetical protein